MVLLVLTVLVAVMIGLLVDSLEVAKSSLGLADPLILTFLVVVLLDS